MLAMIWYGILILRGLLPATLPSRWALLFGKSSMSN